MGKPFRRVSLGKPGGLLWFDTAEEEEEEYRACGMGTREEG